jgi:hypothetical protein
MPTGAPPPAIDDRSGNRQSINYQSYRPNQWVVIASFRNPSDWHAAARVLNRVEIVTRLEDDPADRAASALAVLAPEAEISRQLLAAASKPATPARPQVRAFPVVMPAAPLAGAPPLPEPPPAVANVLPVRPPPPGGSESNYALIMTVLWLVLAAILIATIVPLFPF